MAKNDIEMDDDFNENDDMVLENDSDDDVVSKASADDEFSSEAARRRMREAMAAEVEAFLSRGGSIQHIEPNVMADPPRKPQTSYGSRPI
ncbi:MAG TPA: hypothetical protein DEA26_10800 [Oceanospirillales bacterium]|nr:hypothetical protein [Oceanospirillaceae bacterium]HBS43161.1 hypothetical protein [Oceanospirillales bacterium]